MAAATVTVTGTAAARDAKGPLTITGVVTDARGRALPSLQVTLEAGRSIFSFKTMRRGIQAMQRVSAETNERGEYSLVWPRSDYYDGYALVVEVPVQEAGVAKRLEMARLEVTPRLRRAEGTLVVALSIDDTKFLDTLTGFVASLRSDDERRIYAEQGRPDSVDTVQFADRVEASWWYFETGRVIRFRDGAVVEQATFEPVRPFPLR
jgi:hypothetical protein